MTRLLVRNATVVPMDGPATAPLGDVGRRDLALRDGCIEAIGALDQQAGDTVLDADGLVAMPGFVQGHVHFCQTLFRGLADDLPLMEWLRQRIWPLETAHDEASLTASAELSIAELLRGGTTTVQVMESVRGTEASFAAAARSGMTVVMGNCLMDLGGDGVPAGMPMTAADSMRACEQLRAAFDRRGRLHYAVSPRFVLSCSETLARDAAAFARQHELRVHTHANEHPAEAAEVRALRGAGALEVLDAQGLLGERTAIAHCVHTSPAERALLTERGVAVLHCPSTNLKLGSGIAPIADYVRRGLRVGLGADGAPANNRLSALTELRQAALLQAAMAGPGAFGAAQALAALTRAGASALGLDDEVGSLEVGKRADVVLVDLARHGPGGDPLSRLVYAADDSDIRHVILGGALVRRDGAWTDRDEGALRANAEHELCRLRGRAGI